MFERIGGRFPQRRSRLRAQAHLRGLLSGAERKNGWHLSEYAGEATPDGMQRLLNGYCWDAAGVRDDLRGYVIDHLGQAGGVLVPDETGFVKKGARSVGVRGSTRALLAGSRTARSGCSWPTPQREDGP